MISIQRYVILKQDAIAAMVFVREDSTLLVGTLAGGDTLHTPEIDVQVPITAFYTRSTSRKRLPR